MAGGAPATAHAREGVLRPAPTPALTWGIALAGAFAASAALLFALSNEAIGGELGEPLVIAVLSDWVTASYIVCGLIAWWRRPASRLGLLMIGAGFANVLSTLSWTTNEFGYTIGQALDFVPAVLFLHVALAWPEGRLHGRFERRLVVAAYATAIGLELLRMSLGGFGPLNLLEVVDNPELSAQFTRLQLVTMSGFCFAALGILVERRRRHGPQLRRPVTLLVDAFALGLIMIAALYLSHVVEGPAIPQLRWAVFATLGLAPIAFLVALLDARLARASVADFFIELEADPAPADLRDALARALRDPSLELAYWLPDFASYADEGGRPLELSDGDARRATTLIDRDGDHVAALVHDPALLEEPELLDGVTAAAGIALENGRLHAELRARLEELRGSRARIVAAGQSERKRLERNLHDGAQQRLIALSLELGMLEASLEGKPDARRRLDLARREIAQSLEELRDVSRGLHPAVVSGHGLAVGLEQLAARAPVPVRLDVHVDGRLEEPLEVAAFYLVSESLANVGKHARATGATVDVSLADGRLVVEVADDGVGGADTERGSGLRGLADRVEALGGSLRVWSPAGGGTRLRAEIPCAS